VLLLGGGHSPFRTYSSTEAAKGCLGALPLRWPCASVRPRPHRSGVLAGPQPARKPEPAGPRESGSRPLRPRSAASRASPSASRSAVAGSGTGATALNAKSSTPAPATSFAPRKRTE
jgi:hypothetical protein